MPERLWKSPWRRWTQTAGTLPLRGGGSACRKSVHAKNTRGPASPLRPETKTAPDRPQCEPEPEHGTRISASVHGGGFILAASGQMSEAELEAALFSADAKPPHVPARDLPDFSLIHKELQEHKHVTLQLLWEEYGATHSRRLPLQSGLPPLPAMETPGGTVVMRQEHRPGKKLLSYLSIGRATRSPSTNRTVVLSYRPRCS
jgi:hypothetical protein